MCAGVTSHEAEVTFSEEKLHSTAPSRGCPFLGGQRRKCGRSLQVHPGNLVRGWLLLPGGTQPPPAPLTTWPRCCLPARVHPLCCYPVNSAQPSDLSSVFASVPTAVAMKCQLQSSLTQGHKYYFHRSAIKGLWLLHWAPARVSLGQQRRLPPTGLLPLPVGLLPEQTNTGCREERPLTRESDMTSLLATCIESPLHRATI